MPAALIPLWVATDHEDRISSRGEGAPFALVARKIKDEELAHAHVLEPVGPAVFPMEPGLAVCEAAGDAALALGRVGAVEEGDVLVADVAEPVSY